MVSAIGPHDTICSCSWRWRRDGVMWTIQISIEAPLIPPSSLVHCCTVSTILVIVTIKCAEVHAFVVSHGIIWPWWCPCSLSNVETVLLVRSVHTKLLVHQREFVPLLILQVYSQFHTLSSCQAVYVPQTIPEFRVKITKSFFIIFPSSEEVNCPIRDSTLDHYPPSLVCLHVTSDLCFTRISKRVDSTNICDLVLPRTCRNKWNVLYLYNKKLGNINHIRNRFTTTLIKVTSHLRTHSPDSSHERQHLGTEPWQLQLLSATSGTFWYSCIQPQVRDRGVEQLLQWRSWKLSLLFSPGAHTNHCCGHQEKGLDT